MSITCDGSLMNNVISEFGCTVKVKDISKSYDPNDAYSDPTETGVEYPTTALVNFYNLESEGVKEGSYEPGEITMMFSTDLDSVILVDNLVYYTAEGMWYKIRKVRRHVLADTVYVIEATVERYSSS